MSLVFFRSFQIENGWNGGSVFRNQQIAGFGCLKRIKIEKKKNRPVNKDGLLQILGDLFSKHSSCTSSGYRALGTVASPARLPDPLRITPNALTILWE